MNEHIASFPSETLYDRLLISDSSVAKRTLLSLPSISDYEKDEDAKETLEPTVIFFDTAGCEFYERSEGDSSGDVKMIKGALGEGSKSNENEAVVVAKWARKLVRPRNILRLRKLTSLATKDLARRACSRSSGSHTLPSTGLAHLLDAARGIPGNDDRQRRRATRTRKRGMPPFFKPTAVDILMHDP